MNTRQMFARNKKIIMKGQENAARVKTMEWMKPTVPKCSY